MFFLQARTPARQRILFLFLEGQASLLGACKARKGQRTFSSSTARKRSKASVLGGSVRASRASSPLEGRSSEAFRTAILECNFFSVFGPSGSQVPTHLLFPGIAWRRALGLDLREHEVGMGTCCRGKLGREELKFRM